MICDWGEGVLPYISYIGMCYPKGYGFLAVLVWKQVLIDFDHSGLKIGYGFQGTMKLHYKHICLFNSKWIIENDK